MNRWFGGSETRDRSVHGRLETLSEPGSRDLQRRLGNGGVRRGRRFSAAPDTLVIYAERSLGPRPNSRLAEPTSSFAHTSLSSGELAHHIGDNLAAMMPAPLP